ncbi:MAG: hypothetical protein J0L63_20475 [Anaerolineae bacterium]|nr:hypothetical protein [Anaerolineae bacterium]
MAVASCIKELLLISLYKMFEKTQLIWTVCTIERAMLVRAVDDARTIEGQPTGFWRIMKETTAAEVEPWNMIL